MYPYTCTAHVLRAPFVRARFSRDGSARKARKLDCVAREGDMCDVRVQRGEQERLEQRWLARVHVQLWRCGALPDLDEPGGRERGEEIIAQDTDIADCRGGYVVLIQGRTVGP